MIFSAQHYTVAVTNNILYCSKKKSNNPYIFLPVTTLSKAGVLALSSGFSRLLPTLAEDNLLLWTNKSESLELPGLPPPLGKNELELGLW